MTPQIETRIRIAIKEEGELTVTAVKTVDERDVAEDHTFTNVDEALNEIRILENEHEIYYPF